MLSLPVAVAVPVTPLLPPAPAEEEDTNIYVLQVKMFHIDGIKSALSPYRGFRNYVCHECRSMGLRGFVWRVPNVHGKLLARGTRSQLDLLVDFLGVMERGGFFESYIFERPEFNTYTGNFNILPSRVRFVSTGEYSDSSLHEVLSNSSADTPILQGPPSQL